MECKYTAAPSYLKSPPILLIASQLLVPCCKYLNTWGLSRLKSASSSFGLRSIQSAYRPDNSSVGSCSLESKWERMSRASSLGNMSESPRFEVIMSDYVWVDFPREWFLLCWSHIFGPLGVAVLEANQKTRQTSWSDFAQAAVASSSIYPMSCVADRLLPEGSRTWEMTLYRFG